MDQLIFITGNQLKADALAKWLDAPIKHQKVDLDEIQSLDLKDVVTHKAKQAYDLVKKPVLVEDVALEMTALGKLPGTFVKWFLQEIGLDGLCKLADGLENRKARCAIMYALYDGKTIHYFGADQQGSIADKPQGDNGFGWNAVFIPDGSKLTYGEMDEDTFKAWNIRAHAIKKLKIYLDQA